MPIVVESVGTITVAGAASAPSGVAAGDLLLLVVATEALSGPTYNTPTGWNLVSVAASAAISGTNNQCGIYWRIATGDGDDMPTMTFSGSPSGSAQLMVRISGHDPTTPIQTSGDAGQNSGTTLAIPVLSVTNDGSLSILGASNGGVAGYTFPGSWAENADGAIATVTIGLGSKSVNSGSTATENLTIASSQRLAIVHLIVQPAAGGGGGSQYLPSNWW